MVSFDDVREAFVQDRQFHQYTPEYIGTAEWSRVLRVLMLEGYRNEQTL